MDIHVLNPLLKKLLWPGNQKWLLAGAVGGAFTGLLLFLAAWQGYMDFRTLFQSGTDSRDQFVQVNKKVNVFNTIGVKSVFSQEEREELSRQDFVLDNGAFIANDFKVAAYSELLGFYTELFFEAVPERFLDVDEPQFRWSKGQRELPVILSRDYLALYNFGFAPSQGLPQISATSAGRLELEVRVSGRGRSETFKGRVVAFSDRINSVLVPPSFMDWANREFGKQENQAPSRLIIQVTNPLSEDFQDYLKEKGYEISTGRLIGGQFVVLFKLLSTVVAVLGVFILLLSLQVFILNYQLLISKNAVGIKRLLELGYYEKTISGVISRRFLVLFATVCLLVLAVLWALKFWLASEVKNQGFVLDPGLHISTWLTALIVALLIIWFTLNRIRRQIRTLQ